MALAGRLASRHPPRGWIGLRRAKASSAIVSGRIRCSSSSRLSHPKHRFGLFHTKENSARASRRRCVPPLHLGSQKGLGPCLPTARLVLVLPVTISPRAEQSANLHNYTSVKKEVTLPQERAQIALGHLNLTRLKFEELFDYMEDCSRQAWNWRSRGRPRPERSVGLERLGQIRSDRAALSTRFAHLLHQAIVSCQASFNKVRGGAVEFRGLRRSPTVGD